MELQRAVAEYKRAFAFSDGPLWNQNGPLVKANGPLSFPKSRYGTQTARWSFPARRWRTPTSHSGFRWAVGELQRAILVSDGPLENFNGPFWFPGGPLESFNGPFWFPEGRWGTTTGHSGFRRAVGELQ